jgi:hypothetical protein
MKPKLNYTKLLPILTLIVLLIALPACGSNTAVPTAQVIYVTATPEVAEALPTATPEISEQEAPNDTPEPEPTNTPEPTQTPVPEYYLGDAVESYGYALTAVSVLDPATPAEYHTPADGNKVVAVEVIISNISGDMLSVAFLNATLVDSEGFTYQAELSGVESEISTIDLNVGEKVRGYVAFQVPENAIPASLKYSVDYGSSIIQASLIPPPDGHTPITETQAEEPAQPLPKLGEVVEQYGYSITALTVEDPATPVSWYEPKEGYKLVAVEIILGNVSGDPLNINPLFSFLIDSDGFVYEAELGAREGQIDTTAINAGEKVQGWISYTIPEDASPAVIKYQVALMTSNYLYTGLGK